MNQTPDYYTICSSCNNKTMSLYSEYDPKSQKYILRCQKCSFSKPVFGASSYVPCLKCVPPNINWFCQKTYGDIAKDCGNHCPPSPPMIDIFD